MKKSRVLFSFLSILLCVSLCGLTFSTSVFAEMSEKDVAPDNAFESVSKLTDFGKNLLDRVIGNSEGQQESSSNSKKNTLETVYIGGTPIGLKLYCDGVVVVGMDDVDSENGSVNPAKNAGLQKGDVIKEINGTAVTRNSDVSDIIEKSSGTPLEFTIERGGATQKATFRSVYSKADGRYKAGLWIRDSSAGIGMLSFYDTNGWFASLGHAVCDVDTGEILPLSDGETTDAEITGLFKGSVGTAGELSGTLGSKVIGKIYLNDATGVYGKLFSPDLSVKQYAVANPSEVKVGKAQIVTTVEQGKTLTYEIEIIKINKSAADNKNLVLRVTDQALIAKTGGIVQGMSGSPIIQNGKLVGVVTHVLLNDPTGGYGIFAATMLEKVTALRQKEAAA